MATMSRYGVRAKMLASLLVLVLIILGLVFLLGRENKEETNSLVTVVFVREVYERDGRWRVIVDEVAGLLGEECPNNFSSDDCIADTSGRTGSPSLVEYELARRVLFKTSDNGAVKNEKLSPRALQNILHTDNRLQEVPFVLTTFIGQAVVFEEIAD